MKSCSISKKVGNFYNILYLYKEKAVGYSFLPLRTSFATAIKNPFVFYLVINLVNQGYFDNGSIHCEPSFLWQKKKTKKERKKERKEGRKEGRMEGRKERLIDIIIRR